MICPVMTSSNPDEAYVGCTGKECAWWSKFYERCAMHTIASALGATASMKSDEVS